MKKNLSAKKPAISEEQASAETQRFFVKVYAWMALALSVTALISFWASSSPQAIQFLTGYEYTFMILLMIEFLLVAFLVGWIMKMSPETAGVVFLLYSMLNGLTLSVIFLIFTTDSIVTTFLITAGTFILMSIYGYFTKSDLTTLGNILFMGLLGLILASVVNFFFQNEVFYWITTFAGVIIFTGLIAYDTQKIKKLNQLGNEGTDDDKREAIIGALSLYLDFINLFLKLLRIFGKRR
jgi:FtsH-binding integral membrane protein